MKYLTVEDYQSSIFSLNKENENLEKYISLAEQDLEIITYNSISNFSNLSSAIQEIIKFIF